MKQQNQMAKLCLGAVIAALYTVLTLALPVLSYGPIQFRLAEGMTVLAWLCPEAIPGLTLGCFLSNLIGSPYALDWIMGTLATFIAALWTARVSKRWMAHSLKVLPQIPDLLQHKRQVRLIKVSVKAAGGTWKWKMWNGCAASTE